MFWESVKKTSFILTALGVLASCAGQDNLGDSLSRTPSNLPAEFDPRLDKNGNLRDSIFDIFSNTDDPNVTLEVNKYIWAASLDVLNFLPIQTIDPFSGVIVMGYGTPPGGRQAYRATVFVRDPALDARSLNLSLQTRRGPADRDTLQAVEDAILSRARQLRIQDSKL